MVVACKVMNTFETNRIRLVGVKMRLSTADQISNISVFLYILILSFFHFIPPFNQFSFLFHVTIITTKTTSTAASVCKVKEIYKIRCKQVYVKIFLQPWININSTNDNDDNKNIKIYNTNGEYHIFLTTTNTNYHGLAAAVGTVAIRLLNN